MARRRKKKAANVALRILFMPVDLILDQTKRYKSPRRGINRTRK